MIDGQMDDDPRERTEMPTYPRRQVMPLDDAAARWDEASLVGQGVEEAETLYDGGV